jgi:hypothetical protein
VELQPVTNTSIANVNRSMDSWWGCVHEIAINNTDVCIGDFWVTNERAAYMAGGGGADPYTTSAERS